MGDLWLPGMDLGVPAEIGIGDKGYPPWLPLAPSGNRPLIYADFAGGHYWANGAIVTLADVWVQNTDWGNFDPSSVVAAHGLDALSADGAPSLNPDLFSLVDTTATVVLIAEFDDLSGNGGYSSGPNFVDLVNFNFQATAQFFSFGFGSIKGQFDAPDGSTINDNAHLFLQSPLQLAANFYQDHIVGSSMGFSNLTKNGAASPGPTSWCISTHRSGAQTYIRSIAFYSLQADADLPALSAP